MHRLTLIVVGLLLGAPLAASAQTNQTVGTGCWTRGPNIDTSTVSLTSEKTKQSCVTGVSPGQKAWFVVSGDADGEDNTNANEDDGDRDSSRLNVSLCHSITTSVIKKVGDSNTFEGIFMFDVPVLSASGTTEASNTSFPVCADYDADGDLDCTVHTGDTGIDQDNDSTSMNDSLLWDYGPLPADHLWWDTTVEPGTSKVGVVVVSCGGPKQS
jgi:hypothetical protein